MAAPPVAWARRVVANPRDRWFAGALAALTALALWCRTAALSHGSFYRDDAWVALTSRVPWHDAWRMVGTAPGFVLLERFWVGLTDPSTWNAQLPTLICSLLAVVAAGLVARWWGLSRAGALLVAALIAVGRVDVQYATHLKPYATDVLAGALVLYTAEVWRRGRSAWPFALVSLVSLAVSFSVAPVVVACGAVMGVQALARHRTTSLLGPAVALVAPFVALYWRVHQGISPQLKVSWAANFFSFRSPHAFVHSVRFIFGGLIWGFIDTTPHWHVAGLSKAIIAAVLVTAVLGLVRWRTTVLPAASVVAAVVFAAVKAAPLGTGRTDAYLYPAIALLVASGVTVAVEWLARWRRAVARVAVAAVVVLVGFLALDEAVHRPTYPGGNIASVTTDVNTLVREGGGVIIEGTARWPWTYYEEQPVRLFFSNLYNTGFAPLSNNPQIVIMPGSVIEGGYDPAATVTAVKSYSTVLYVRTDDWPTLGDPMPIELTHFGYHEVQQAHPPGYLLSWWAKPTSITPTFSGPTHSSLDLAISNVN
jgi:hypothetical protein